MNRSVSTVSRRFFVAGAAGVLAAPMILRASRAAPKADSLTITGGGGSYQENLINYVMKPFTEETGIKVNFVPVPDLAKVKAQLLTGNIQWDIIGSLSGALAAVGSRNGYWEKLDPSLFDLSDLVVPPTSDVVTFEVFSVGIGWDPKRFGPGKHPANFAEFFDVKKFPGRRAIRNYADRTLEMALLADGVAPKDMYPLDLDRAFKAFDRIKPSVAAWTASAAQTISLLQTGEVDFADTYPNRVKATTEPGGGVPLAISFEQNVLDSDVLVVIKGAPNKENAMRLISYILRPEVQVRLGDRLGLLPVSKKAAQMLSVETRKWLPDPNNPKNLFINAAYWADNYDAVWSRFQEWVRS